METGNICSKLSSSSPLPLSSPFSPLPLSVLSPLPLFLSFFCPFLLFAALLFFSLVLLFLSLSLFLFCLLFSLSLFLSCVCMFECCVNDGRLMCVVSFALWCGCVGVCVCVAQLDDFCFVILCVVWSPCHVSVHCCCSSVAADTQYSLRECQLTIIFQTRCHRSTRHRRLIIKL